MVPRRPEQLGRSCTNLKGFCEHLLGTGSCTELRDLVRGAFLQVVTAQALQGQLFGILSGAGLAASASRALRAYSSSFRRINARALRCWLCWTHLTTFHTKSPKHLATGLCFRRRNGARTSWPNGAGSSALSADSLVRFRFSCPMQERESASSVTRTLSTPSCATGGRYVS